MSAEEALDGLVKAFSGDPATNVLLIAEPAAGTVIQRLNLSTVLAAEFRSAAQSTCSYAVANRRLRRFDPGYKPDPDEPPFINLGREAELNEQIQQLTRVQQAELFTRLTRWYRLSAITLLL